MEDAMQRASRLRAVTAVAALLAAGCNGQNIENLILRPPCAVQKRAAADFGAPSPRSQTSSVDVEIARWYVRDRIGQQFDSPLPEIATDQELAVPEGQPNYIPQGGVLVHDVSLEEKTVGSERVNLLSVVITPWLLHKERDQQQPDKWKLSKTQMNRFFDLRLRLAPRLITPATVPDAARRRTLLQCGSDPSCGGSGAVVPLELYELYDRTEKQTVMCRSADDRNSEYDIVTQKVHQGVLDALYGTDQKEGAPPLVLPAQTIVELVSKIANAPVQLDGIALGTAEHLKIGLHLNQGSAEPFDPEWTQVGLHLSDWRVRIDTSFITASVAKKVREKAAAHNPPVSVSDVSVAYTRQVTPTGPPKNIVVVDAPATATALGCTVPVHIHAEISLDIRRNASDSSVIVAKDTSSATPTLNACIIFNSLLFGESTMTICKDGRCPGETPPDPCPEMGKVQFKVGPGDTFYGVAMSTDNEFSIFGRSILVDARLPAGDRPPVPTCP
jgi:hypothetical protein